MESSAPPDDQGPLSAGGFFLDKTLISFGWSSCS